MPRQLHEETDLYTIEYDDEIDAIVHTWNEFASGADFREGCEALLGVIGERGARKMVVDTRGIRAHDEADQQWLEDEWMPRVIDAGMEYAVTVHPDSVISEMDMEDLLTELEDLDYTSKMTDDMAEARRWVAEK